MDEEEEKEVEGRLVGLEDTGEVIPTGGVGGRAKGGGASKRRSEL